MKFTAPISMPLLVHWRGGNDRKRYSDRQGWTTKKDHEPKRGRALFQSLSLTDESKGWLVLSGYQNERRNVGMNCGGGLEINNGSKVLNIHCPAVRGARPPFANWQTRPLVFNDPLN
jgi:hypothetical protein